ncbi:hypothetical protein [Agromyces sp. Soil535]|uniref:hypothetical protein n=1 Tax=Agromyces sp. Soil535 TaxID=1736390 RepID=UPI0006F744D3|nr:hypothetical protein [Agromyces sp. Soil535]KRE28528.1 hypothetical protein ASG80_21035 [Agromyces sp. Soil535]
MTEASVPLGDDAGTTDARSATKATSARPTTPLWLAVTIAVVFGVLYAYDVWEAVGNLVGLNIEAGTLGVSLTGWGIALLVVALVVPFLVFGLAFWLGRHRGPLAQIVLFLAGYAVVQALTLDLSALFELGGLDFS